MRNVRTQTGWLPMAERTILYRANPNSESSDKIQIVDEQQNMLLVNGATQAISKALGDAPGWSVSAETKTPPPNTREKILKPLSK